MKKSLLIICASVLTMSAQAQQVKYTVKGVSKETVRWSISKTGGPCIREMPHVVAAYEKFHDKGLDIVGISLDKNMIPWKKTIVSQNMPWAHLSDLKGWESLVTKVYKINSIPDNLLIDPQGKIVARNLRGEVLLEKLKDVLGE